MYIQWIRANRINNENSSQMLIKGLTIQIIERIEKGRIKRIV